MALISITGTSGVGKSFLTKQLSSLLCVPVILEGEVGTIPQWVFEDVFSKSSTVKRWEYFLDKQNQTFTYGDKISRLGIHCVVDSSPYMMKSLIDYEPQEFRSELERVRGKLVNVKIDVTILLIASEEKLRELIKTRSRKTENDDIDEMLKRSLQLQENFILNTRDVENVIVIERDKLDFTNSNDIELIYNKIKKWL